MLPTLLATLAVATSLCLAAPESGPWQEAQANAVQANDAFARCHKFVEGWLQHRDPKSGLFPQNLKSPLWTAHNSAADLWSFMVLTAYYTDPGWFDGLMRDVLHAEIRLTTRVRRLPDTFAFATQDFESPEVDVRRVIFGAAEYVKDGLLPISEVLGRDEYFYRMRDLVEDILSESPVESQWGRLPGDDTEVNGEMLQSLCRLYCATSDPKFLEAAKRIGDAYFLEVLPACNGLPCHRWDFTEHKIAADRFSLNDHGNEIVGGLSELFLACKTYDPERYAKYEPAMRRLLDTLLEKATNEDGLWYSVIVPSTLEVQSKGTPDTWGYALNGVYTAYLATGDGKYLAAVERALHNLNKDAYKKWGGADAFADSIESGIGLLNRVPTEEGFAWLEDVVPVFLAKQQEDGVIEGWHGDGNYARTALMYALYKTKGTRVAPWRKDLHFGAAVRGDALHVRVEAAEAWQGKLCFDYPRHRDNLGLLVDYPRLNSYPEWYTVDHGALYAVRIGEETRVVTGADLIRGLPLQVEAGKPLLLIVSPNGAPPYGAAAVRFAGRRIIGADGPVDYPIQLMNQTAVEQRVQLHTDWGELTPNSVVLPAEGTASLSLKGTAEQSVDCKLVAALDGGREIVWPLRILCEPGLIDVVETCGHQSYNEECYRWTGDGPIEYEIALRPNEAQVVWLRWGAKDDQRSATLRLGERETEFTHGGYDGFQWAPFALPAEAATAPRLPLTLTEIEGKKGAFVSQIRVMKPGTKPADAD
jgi:hypothetical protein